MGAAPKSSFATRLILNDEAKLSNAEAPNLAYHLYANELIILGKEGHLRARHLLDRSNANSLKPHFIDAHHLKVSRDHDEVKVENLSKENESWIVVHDLESTQVHPPAEP